MSTESHWQQVYDRKSPDEQSWYQPRPAISLEWIDRVSDKSPVQLVDIGGGASTLVDHLLARNGIEVTVVDIASSALESARERLGDHADEVNWIVADMTKELDLDGPVDVWHDRAVFHFLTDANDRDAYLDNLDRNLAQDGHVIISTFAPEGPEKCSGLPVRRYSPESLAEVLGDDWQLVDSKHEVHSTPWGGEQTFIYTLFERA